eukprot:gene10161-12023_t
MATASSIEMQCEMLEDKIFGIIDQEMKAMRERLQFDTESFFGTSQVFHNFVLQGAACCSAPTAPDYNYTHWPQQLDDRVGQYGQLPEMLMPRELDDRTGHYGSLSETVCAKSHSELSPEARRLSHSGLLHPPTSSTSVAVCESKGDVAYIEEESASERPGLIFEPIRDGISFERDYLEASSPDSMQLITDISLKDEPYPAGRRMNDISETSTADAVATPKKAAGTSIKSPASKSPGLRWKKALNRVKIINTLTAAPTESFKTNSEKLLEYRSQLTNQEDEANDAKEEEKRISLRKSLMSVFEGGERRKVVFQPSSTAKKYWDYLLFILLLYISYAVPYKIAFFETDEKWPIEALEWADVICDYCFALDLLINFNTAYIDNTQTVVTNRYKIAQQYIRTWFCLDLMCASTLLLQSGETELLQMGKMLLHVLSCATHAMRMADANYEWLDLDEETKDDGDLDHYLQAFYWTTFTMAGNSTIPVSQATSLYTICIFWTGMVLNGILMGNLLALISNSDMAQADFRMKLERVLLYMRKLEMPVGLRRRILAFMNTNHTMNNGVDTQQFLEELPRQLQQEVATYINRTVVDAVPFLTDFALPFQAALISRLVSRFYTGGTYICMESDSATEVYFLDIISIELRCRCGWGMCESAQ